jgi:hypothetical protein
MRKLIQIAAAAALSGILLLCIITAPVAGAAGDASQAVRDHYYMQRYRFKIPEKGCALFIDLDICTMIVFVDGKSYKAYPVSGGTPDNPSPTGLWRVSGISDWGEGFGGSWIGLNVPWGIYGIHGTVKPWALGEYNISHGCIRMRDEDVAEVKKLVRHGDPVYIKHDSAPFRAVKNGMVGSDVLHIQKMMRTLGFYTGATDGKFGNGMENAVRGFQKTYGLPQDGVVGRVTFEKICEQYEIKIKKHGDNAA